MALFQANSGGVQDIVIQSFSTTVASIGAGGDTSVTFTGIAKTGYTPLIAIYYKNDTTRAILPVFVASPVSSGQSTMAIKNTGTSALTNVTVQCYVIFIKK